MIPGDADSVTTHREAVMITLKAMRHFRLRRDPLSNDINGIGDIFQSEDHLFIREMMLESAKYNGFTALFGEVGSGKSTMRKAVFRELSDAGIQVIYPVILDKSRITATSLLDAIILDISDEAPKRSLEPKTRQAIRLLRNRKSNGLRQVLMIEEAHLLNIHALKALKQIWEFEDGYERLIGVVLIGQPELAGKLDESRYPQLREVIRRVTLAEIEGLKETDIQRYVSHKMTRINADPSTVFTPDAFPALWRRLSATTNGNGKRVSRAYPLSINNIVAQAMVQAAELGEPAVSAEIINSL